MILYHEINEGQFTTQTGNIRRKDLSVLCASLRSLRPIFCTAKNAEKRRERKEFSKRTAFHQWNFTA